MRILLTNDDGYQARGLLALYEQLSLDHQVIVVAPETEQSAIGHAITVSEILRVRVLSLENAPFNGFAVRGTPADCVKLGVYELLDAPPQLVVSGINHGANVGVNILYSGTVSAASDAAILGLPAIAFSQQDRKGNHVDFSMAAAYARKLVNAYAGLEVPEGLLLNVNFPCLPQDRIKGVRLVRQSQAQLNERFERYLDTKGRPYYWPAGETMSASHDPADDLHNLIDGYITITPIGHDLTNYPELARLQKKAGKLPQP